MPRRRNARSSPLLRAMSSFGTRCGSASMMVTSDPKERQTLANSTPITPPPRMSTWSGTTSRARACSLVRIRPADLEAGEGAAVRAGGEHHIRPHVDVVADADAAIRVQAAESGDRGDPAGLDESLEALELLGDDPFAVGADPGGVDALQCCGHAHGRGIAHMVGDLCCMRAAPWSGCTRGAGRSLRPCPSRSARRTCRAHSPAVPRHNRRCRRPGRRCRRCGLSYVMPPCGMLRRRRRSIGPSPRWGPSTVKPYGRRRVRRSRDVEVHPRDARSVVGIRRTTDEAAQEQAGVGGAAIRSPTVRVLQVGDGGFERLLHVLRQRHVPCGLVDLSGRGDERGHGLDVAEDAGVPVAHVRRRWRPVRVATSMMTSGFSRLAATRPSPSTSRPSASVFWTSTVVPSRMRMTSPGRSALPDGMLSVMQSHAVTWTGRPSEAIARIAASDVAAPAMSNFMPTMDAAA